MGISRATAYKWLRRFRDEGVAGLDDRSSRPHASPRLLADESVQRLLDQAAEAGRPTVVDGPPMGVFGDMVPVARRVDAVVVVVRLYFTRRRSLQALARQLDSAGVRPFGLVVVGGKPGEQRYYGA